MDFSKGWEGKDLIKLLQFRLLLVRIKSAFMERLEMMNLEEH